MGKKAWPDQTIHCHPLENHPLQVEHYTREQKDGVLDVLCDAFHDYPVMRYVLNDAHEEYDEHLRLLIVLFCESRLTRGLPLFGISDGAKPVAVAVVSDPVEQPAPPALTVIEQSLAQRIGEGAMARMALYDAACEESDPGRPIHYLGMLGVGRACQGMGYGKGLIEATKALAQSSSRSAGVLLNTETEKNVSYYESQGFRVVGEADAEGLQTWSLFWAKSG